MVNDGLATNRPGVFAAGDFTLGPTTVIEAVAQGNRVADTVAHYLRTGSTELVAVKHGYEFVEQTFDAAQAIAAVRPQTWEIPVTERRGNFDEVELLFDEATIQAECMRCLRCDLEWLDVLGLAHAPVPDHLLSAEGPVLSERRAV